MSNIPTLAITDRQGCKGDFLEQIAKICQTGVTAIILREKDLTIDDYTALAQKTLQITEKYNIPLICHTHIKASLTLNCPNIHLPLPILRDEFKEIGDFKIIGASCHSLEEAREAQQLGATYITLSHIFPTDCKKGLEPKGLDFLSTVVKAVKIPVFGLGGVNPDNANDVISHGCYGIAMMSYFMKL